jgi:DNA-binding CsgD family transcriptional regulator
MREKEIARLAASGLSNGEIGQRLSLSQASVRKYLFRVYEKLGISTPIELVLYTLSCCKENEIADKTFKMGAQSGLRSKAWIQRGQRQTSSSTPAAPAQDDLRST